MDSNSPSIERKRKLNSIAKKTLFALFIIPAIFISLFFLWPVSNLAVHLFDFDVLKATLARPGLTHILEFTFFQAFLSVIATLFVAIGPTYLLARWDFKGRRFLSSITTVPFMLPTVVVASAFLALLPESIHNTILAIVIVHVFFNVSVVIRIVGAHWAKIPRDLENAARTLGSSQLQTLMSITLPLLLPSIISASAIIFLFTFTSFGVIKIIGGPSNVTLEVEIARRALFIGDLGSAAVLSFIQLVFLGFVIWLTNRYSKLKAVGLSGKKSDRQYAKNKRQRFLISTSSLMIFVFVVVPIFSIFISSFKIGSDWSFFAWSHLNSPSVRPGVSTGIDPLSSIGFSVRYMVAASVISVVIGTLGALAINEARRLGKFLDIGLMVPIGTSAVTIGLGILITFDRAPFDWRSSTLLIPVGQSLIAIPFVIRILLPVLRSQPVGYTMAASTLGASPIRRLLTIDLVRLRKPIGMAAGIAAAISLGEFGATTLLSRSGSESMPLAIAQLLGKTGDIPRAQAYVLSTILAVITFFIVFAIEVRDA